MLGRDSSRYVQFGADPSRDDSKNRPSTRVEICQYVGRFGVDSSHSSSNSTHGLARPLDLWWCSARRLAPHAPAETIRCEVGSGGGRPPPSRDARSVLSGIDARFPVMRHPSTRATMPAPRDAGVRVSDDANRSDISLHTGASTRRTDPASPISTSARRGEPPPWQRRADRLCLHVVAVFLPPVVSREP
jgi:hypothetical protein